MKKLFLISAILVSVSLSATLRNVTNPGNYLDIRPNIATQVTAAVNGDTIVIPAGVFKFSERIYVSKKISFRGAGIRSGGSGTLLYRDSTVSEAYIESTWPNMFYFDIDTRLNTGMIFSDMTIQGKNPALVTGDGGSEAADNCLYFRLVTGVRVTRCKFMYFGESAIHIKHHNDVVNMVIDHCEFYRNAKGTTGLGLGYGVVIYGNDTTWIGNAQHGTSNFVFIEDCTFDYQRHAVAAGSCARYVARYNTVRENTISHAFDAHEADGNPEDPSTRAVEIYHNTITNTKYNDYQTNPGGSPINLGSPRGAEFVTQSGIRIRGGSALVHHNTISGFMYGVSIITFYIPTGMHYPVKWAPGYASGLALDSLHSGEAGGSDDGDLYSWANTFTTHVYSGTQYYTSENFHNGGYDESGGWNPFVNNRDYHFSNTADPAPYDYSFKPNYAPYPYPHPMTVTPVTGGTKRVYVTPVANFADIRTNINTAVTAAVKGDTIVLPAGVFSVSNTVTITKLVHLKGAGIGLTTLYRDEATSDATLTGWKYMIHYNINSDLPSNIDVSAITFKSQYPEVINGDGGSLAEDVGIQFTNCVDFKVRKCRFEYFGDGAISIKHKDELARGLIYQNEFYHNQKGDDGLGLGYGVVIYGANLKWIANPRLGSNNFIFIEDNFFDTHRHSIAAGGAALYVARYNRISTNLLGHAIDTHNRQTSVALGNGNYFGTRAVEIYNNIIYNSLNTNGGLIYKGQNSNIMQERAIAVRAGDCIVDTNTVVGYRFAVGLSFYPDPGSPLYPIPGQIGYLSGKLRGPYHTGTNSTTGDGDAFIWSNVFTAWPTGSTSQLLYNYYTSLFISARDYHTVAKPGYSAYKYPHPKR